MKHFFFRRWTITPFILILLLVLSACQSAAETPVAETQTPVEVTSDEVIVQGDLVFGPGAFNLLDTKAGLADLSSYKATLVLSFDGTRQEQSSQWSKTYVMQSAKQPAALQLLVEKTGDLSDLDAVFMAEMDGAFYQQRAGNACNANVIEAGNSLAERYEPAGFLTGVVGAEEAGSETVNNVAVDHYTFDERAFGQLGVAKSTGEMWVAHEGGYIVKYRVTTEGTADYFGEGIQGTLTWDYELTDINGSIPFELPADCPAGMLDVPQMPDATNILNMPGILTFDTASSLADVTAFYQEQIPNLGWLLLSEPAITETSALVEYQQDDRNLTVIIATEAGVTTVTLLLERAQE